MATYIETEGNLLNSEAKVLVNAVNRLGFMGAGIALGFKLKFPEMFKAYQNACKNGMYSNSCLTTYLDSSGKLIANLRTVDDNLRGQYSLVKQGLYELKNIILTQKIETIAIPPLGCGIGGLNRTIIKNLIKEVFKDLVVTIYLYNFKVEDGWRRNYNGKF